MLSRLARLSVIALALTLGGTLAVHAADGEKKGEGRRGAGGAIKFLLSKAEDYKLTDEQKTKLEALAKENEGKTEKADREAMTAAIGKILTPEQLAKWEEARKAMREKRGEKKAE
jgi:Spy/CpxP family protein refolding chaperone